MQRWLVPCAGWLGLAIGVAGGTGCGNTFGRDPDPQGAPDVGHIVLLDQSRGTNPDLINNAPAPRCDNANPCTAPVECGVLFFNLGSAGVHIGFPIDDLVNGPTFCRDPENINEVAPSVDAAIRVAFNKQIDVSSIEDSTSGVIDPAVVVVRDGSNNVVAGETTYDRTGSPTFTSDPNILPYGPALVFTPESQLTPGERYTITLNPSLIKARNNPAGATLDPSDASFSFTAENFFVMGQINCPEIAAGFNCTIGGASVRAPYQNLHFPDPEFSSPPPPVYRNQGLQYQFNAYVNPSSLAGITVRDAQGNLVNTMKIGRVTDQNGDGRLTTADCPTESPDRWVRIVRADALGAPTNWAAGAYTLTIPGGAAGVQALNGTQRLARDYTVTFTVMDADAPAGDPLVVGEPLRGIVVCP